MSEVQFNLERKIAIENMVDPTGKQWVIKGERGTALVQARPDPDRADAQIPDAFHGKWTSPTVLKEKVVVWLNKQWDKSDEAVRLNALRAGRTAMAEKIEVPEEVKQTPEESLAALDPEIAAELGDIIAVEEPEKAVPDGTKLVGMSMDELREIATPLGIKGTSKKVLIEGIQVASK